MVELLAHISQVGNSMAGLGSFAKLGFQALFAKACGIFKLEVFLQCPEELIDFASGLKPLRQLGGVHSPID